MKKRSNIFFSAMTFIELLLAIAVFGVGILGVLQVLLSMIKTEDKVMTQTTATMLAQEGLYIIYHMRDTNKILEQKWDCVPHFRQSIAAGPGGDQDCLTTFTDLSTKPQGLRVGFSVSEKVPYSINVVNLGSGFMEKFYQTRLFLGGYKLPTTDFFISFYTNSFQGNIQDTFMPEVSTSGFMTPFARYVTFTGVIGFDVLSGVIYKISSHVLYVKGSLTGEVVLESFIGKLDKQQTPTASGTEEIFTVN